MLTKKVYIPIGVCLFLLLAIGFLSLRSDVVDEPIIIYKATQPAETSETQTETANSDTQQGGHLHADGTLRTEPVKSSPSDAAVQRPETDIPETAIAFGGEKETQPPQPPSDEYLAEQRYNIAAAEYFRAMQEYHKKDQALMAERAELFKVSDDLNAEKDRFINRVRGLNKAEFVKHRKDYESLVDRRLTYMQKRDELDKRIEVLRAAKPIPPTRPSTNKEIR